MTDDKKDNRYTSTENELKILTECANKKMSDKETHEILKTKSEQGIRGKRTKLRLLQFKNFKWTKEADEILLNLIKQDKDATEIAKKIGITVCSFYHRALKHGFSYQKIGKFFGPGIQFKEKYNNSKLAKFIYRKYQVAKSSAKRKNLNFDLSPEFLLELYNKQEGKCYYTGIKMLMNQSCNPHLLSLDRINSTLGYTKNNVVFCCFHVNIMKRDLTINEFFQFCKQIVEYNKI